MVATFHFQRNALYNNPGGDLVDCYNGAFEAYVLLLPLDCTSTRDGQETLNSTMLGVELAAYAVFKGGRNASSSNSAELLLQQVTGDLTVPNSNTDLLSLAKGLTTYNDGNNALDNVTRSRWIFANYAPLAVQIQLYIDSLLIGKRVRASSLFLSNWESLRSI